MARMTRRDTEQLMLKTLDECILLVFHMLLSIAFVVIIILIRFYNREGYCIPVCI